ncbi:MAG TPA: pyruvate, water dikinase regulatory protein [Humisphaera sp.]|nr:pyruvate, water dikinase regulatory protein [Humisphaera sp.]
MRIARRSPSARKTSRPPSEPAVVYVLSDSTGNLARHMLAAFLTQFPTDALCVRYENFIRTKQRLATIFAKISADASAVFHAFVSPALKQEISRRCKQAKISSHDLTGGAIEFLTRATGAQPLHDPKSLHRIDDGYERRIDAVEFAMAHDDGLGLETLHEAQIVLAGVSRTGKTPTTIYLAQQGFRAANVSLALGVEPPRQLLALPRGRVAGLLIDPEKLARIRVRRETAWHMTKTSYGDEQRVADELTRARRLFNQQGWPMLDVTDQAIEETAGKVIEVLGVQ